MNDFHSEALDELFEAVLKLDGKKECYDFFIDLCTVNELKAMGQRFSVAKLLANGERFGEIEQKTSASPATISRVNRCLKYGTGGYKSIIGKIGEKDER